MNPPVLPPALLGAKPRRDPLGIPVPCPADVPGILSVPAVTEEFLRLPEHPNMGFRWLKQNFRADQSHFSTIFFSMELSRTLEVEKR